MLVLMSMLMSNTSLHFSVLSFVLACACGCYVASEQGPGLNRLTGYATNRKQVMLPSNNVYKHRI